MASVDGKLPRGARPHPDGGRDDRAPADGRDVLFVGRPVIGQEERVVSLFKVQADGDARGSKE